MLVEMTFFRLIALITSFICGSYLLRLVHHRKLSGFEFLLWFAIIIIIIVLSLFPEIIILIFKYLSLSMNNRYDRLVGLSFILISFSYFITFYYRNRTHVFRSDFINFFQLTIVNQFIEKYKKYKKENELYIIIPAFNEEKNISNIIKRIPKEVCDLTTKIVVINDGSTDGTMKVAESNGAWVADNPINFGQGVALETGYRCAIAMEASYVVTMDADGQYQPEEIKLLIQPIIDGNFDMVSGSRTLGYYDQKYAKNHLIRSIGIQFFNFLLTILTGKKITDSSSGFRAVKVEFLNRLKFVQEQFHSSEFLIECLKKGLRFKEVPISFLPRTSGQSKKPQSFKYGVGFFRAVFKTWMRK